MTRTRSGESFSLWLAPLLLLSNATVSSAQPAPPAPAPAPPAQAGVSRSAAPAASPAAPLTLADAVRAAVARSPEADALAATVAAARARAPIARELMPPMFEAQAWQWPLDTANPQDVQWMFGIEQQFPGRGKRDARGARVEAEARLMANEIRAVRRAAATDTARAYLDLRVAREELATLESARALVRQSVDASEARYAAGQSPQADMLAGIVELARLAQEDVTARERERLARSTLNVLLGRDPDEPVGPVEEAVAERGAPKLADVEARLREHHPEMTALDRAREVASADLAIARQSTAPDYLVSAGYMTMPSMRDAVQFKVGVSWPQAPWVKQRAKKEAAAAAAAATAADARRPLVAQRLRLMAQDATIRAEAAAERASVIATSIVPPAEHALEVARVAYLADRGEFMPVIDAQRVLLDARLEIRRALGDRDRALADLAVLLGEYDGSGPNP
jgi:cobalt-zinc-cadmium efflux system outer membrane protein